MKKSFWIIWLGPKFNGDIFIKDTNRKDRGGRSSVMREAEQSGQTTTQIHREKAMWRWRQRLK